MKIELYPLDKVLINGISIKLGMDKSSVEAEIGEGEHIGKRYYYYNSEMAIDYDNDQNVEFIEFLGGFDGALKPVIYGVSAFDVPADELIGILAQKNDGEVNDNEHGYSYGFLNISVGVYRETIPHGKRKESHWSTIGIGVKDYYQSIAR